MTRRIISSTDGPNSQPSYLLRVLYGGCLGAKGKIPLASNL
ncbi:MAG TPA: hypothetical protein VKR57_04675 [Terriglobales bacterium]|jgi:hypothetical protein|nr:hypothetical protein [Terriglobales bacterium]